MATGFINDGWAAFVRGGAGSFELAPLPQDERGLVHAVDEPAGQLTFVNPDPISQSYGGHRTFTFLDDFYFRVYLIPQVLDFGAIVTTVTREVQVWNAYFEPVTLFSITPQFGVEVVQGGPALPNVIPALTLRAWDFTVSTEGPPTLDESFEWVFSTGEEFTLPVTGTRSVLWPFLPNWSSPFRYTLEYDTSVFTARSGREQRRAEREYPRTSMEFDVMMHGVKREQYRRLMAFWQDRPFVVADISRNVTTEAALLTGGTTVVVSDAESWLMQEDRAVVLVSGNGPGQQIGLRVIDSIDDSNNTLTFKDTDGVNWPSGTIIYAGVVANLEDTRTTARRTNDALTGTVRFNILPGSELIDDPEAATLFFQDREVFLTKPNWGQSNEGLDEHITEYVDYGVGRLERFSPVSYGSRVWTQNYLGRNAAGIRSLLDFFRRMNGRQGEFYMPTWEDDITPKIALASGSLGLRVEGLDFLVAYADDATKRAIMVELNNGTRIFRAVDEIIDIDDPEGHDTLINMTESWDSDIEVADIKQVCWLMCWRFETDDLTAEFLTNSVANLSMNHRTLEDLPAESEEGSNSP